MKMKNNGNLGINNNKIEVSPCLIKVDVNINRAKTSNINKDVANNIPDNRNKSEIIDKIEKIVKEISDDSFECTAANGARIKAICGDEGYHIYTMYSSFKTKLDEELKRNKAFFDGLIEDFDNDIKGYIEDIKEEEEKVFAADSSLNINRSLVDLSESINRLYEEYQIEENYEDLFKALYSRKKAFLEYRDILIECLEKNY